MNIGNTEAIKSAITQAFSDDRAFPFRLAPDLVESIRNGASPSEFRNRFAEIREESISQIAADPTVYRRLHTDARLTGILPDAIATLHQIAANHTELNLIDRRYVILKPDVAAPGSTTPPVLTHAGLGPRWVEIPSIYLDLRLFDLADAGSTDDERQLIEELTLIEERCVENGFTYLRADSAKKSAVIETLTERLTRIVPAPTEAVLPPAIEIDADEICELLDSRVEGDELNFVYETVIEGVARLEEAARVAKASNNIASLRRVIELLVAASGHDLHDARDRANLALERIFSPKPYDAPPATEFRTVTVGDRVELELALAPSESGYDIELYTVDDSTRFTTDANLQVERYPLTRIDDGSSPSGATARYRGSFVVDSPGFADWIVRARQRETTDRRIPSGRINILPDVSGDIVLQIFPDIHGHTRVYWKRGDGHPGLVYNETGEVIRLGNFDDITAHLEDLQAKYRINGIYLLGVQTRGTHKEDWAPGATSPSPFSPISLTEIEPSLGGSEAFKRLVAHAHELGIQVIVDILPHLNRHSQLLPDDLAVTCYDTSGNLVVRASTDGRYGSWNDGKLLNYRRFEVWEWFAGSIETLVEEYGVDGVRIDTAHAVPIMMKRNNFPLVYERRRSHREMVYGEIIVNDREDDHLITTGYYDSACRDRIACPFYTFLNRYIRPAISRFRNDSFIILAECYWGRERYLARSGVIPYNSALFKICENITHGNSDVREIYHLYDHYYAQALPPGTTMIGIFGNHDERRALNTFGERGLRAAIALTAFVSRIIMDYEGSAEGESWKVFMDNIFVNWNQFEIASHRSLDRFYHETYALHRETTGPGHLLWTENHLAAAAVKPKSDELLIGAFSFSGDTQSVTLHFDAPDLPIDDGQLYRLLDPIYSAVTGRQGYYVGHELRASRVHTVVPYTDRVKYLVLEKRPAHEIGLADVFRDSFHRIRYLTTHREFRLNLAFRRLVDEAGNAEAFAGIVASLVLPISDGDSETACLGLKRVLYHAHEDGAISNRDALSLIERLKREAPQPIGEIGARLAEANSHGAIVFISAEADPFSKSGGLGNVAFELPRELAAMGEEVYVITPKYRHGSGQAVEKMGQAIEEFDVRYTGTNVRFHIESGAYEVGVHRGNIGQVTYFLPDHHEFFDGLYWGYTAEDRLRRRVALARASAEIVVAFGLEPLFVFTNDAFTGVFNGIVRGDHYYREHPQFRRTSFFHIIHNGGWQYFDAYNRFEGGKDLFSLFNLPAGEAHNFCDPTVPERLNCMAAGIRYADRSFTVSPSYAEQLKAKGDGLEHIIGNVIGINNAIATDYADRALRSFHDAGIIEASYGDIINQVTETPLLFELIQERYPEILAGPAAPDEIKQSRRREIVTHFRNRLVVQHLYQLSLDPDAIVCTMLHRVADQKGYQLLLDASEGIIRDLGVQLVVGGPVNWDDQQSEELAHGLEQLGAWYPGRVSVRLGFQDVRIPLLGSDAFLMPSRHEPGGISQLEALACGCLVIARATGGLRDTVRPIEPNGRTIEGNGVLFTDYTPGAFYDALARFATLWRAMSDGKRHTARNRARKSVYYWDRPAERYLRAAYAHKEIIRQ